MSKINHSRPHLRFIDNLRRELAREASAGTFAPAQVQNDIDRRAYKTRHEMPELGPSAARVALKLLDLLTQYQENQSLLIGSISPQSAKSERKKTKSFISEKEDLEGKIFKHSKELVSMAFLRQADGDSSISEWISWLQAKAISMNSYALLDLFEIGIKPAFEALSEAISQHLSRR